MVAPEGDPPMLPCHSSSATAQSNWKMALYAGLGISVFTILLFGLLLGLGVIQISGFEPQQEQKCLRLNESCTTEEDGVESAADTMLCCAPYVCRQVSGQQSRACILEYAGSDYTTTQEPFIPPDRCPYSGKLEQLLDPVRSGEEFEKALTFYDEAKNSYLRLSSHRGDATKNFLLSVRELNADATSIIRSMAHNVGKNIYPLIVAIDNENNHALKGVGGTFTLYLEDGSVQSVTPVDVEYEIRKGVSHIPLAIFGIIVPYFQMSHAPRWNQELKAFGDKVTSTIIATRLAAGQFPSEMHRDCLRMLEITSSYISQWLTQSNAPNEFQAPRTVSEKDFEEYAEEMFPHLDKSIRIAADLQMKAVVPVLKKWKAELGEEKWKEVYAVIPTIWPVTGMNPRFQALATVMSPQQAQNQIFNFENTGSLEELRNILGKIITHRTAGHLIFGSSSKRGRELNFALSGRQDIMSNDAEDTLKTIYKAINSQN